MVEGSAPLSASSMRMLSKSPSVAACVEMMMLNGASCAPTAVSRASYSADRGPRTRPSSSWMIRLGDRPKAVVASADNAR